MLVVYTIFCSVHRKRHCLFCLFDSTFSFNCFIQRIFYNHYFSFTSSFLTNSLRKSLNSKRMALRALIRKPMVVSITQHKTTIKKTLTCSFSPPKNLIIAHPNMQHVTKKNILIRTICFLMSGKICLTLIL